MSDGCVRILKDMGFSSAAPSTNRYEPLQVRMLRANWHQVVRSGCLIWRSVPRASQRRQISTPRAKEVGNISFDALAQPDLVVHTRRPALPPGLRFACTVAVAGSRTIKRRGARGDVPPVSNCDRRHSLPTHPQSPAPPVGRCRCRSSATIWSTTPPTPTYNTLWDPRHRRAFPRSGLARTDTAYYDPRLFLYRIEHGPGRFRPGHTSATSFFTAGRGPAAETEGCVALAPEHLAWIAPRIRYETRLVVRG